MNTEKMIPIDFCRNITPFVPGDVYYNNFVDAEFTMDQRDADIFNNADPRGEFNTYFIVSFADRPNTGTQPVGDDVIVDMSKTLGGPRAASELRWARIGIIPTWKPNHEAMLAKFKEQGANTMYTGKKAAEATHIIGLYFKKIIPGNNPEFLSKDGVWLLSSFSVKSALTHKSLIELSRPVGERKEDHTIDGILKKAQPQGAKAYEVALMIEALDDNPDEPVPVAESMPFSSDHYVTSPKDFGAVKDDEQVIEPWVADHITDKPVFTQEMADAGDRPKAMMECLVFNTLLDNPKYEKAVIDFIGEWCCVYTSESCRERSASVDDLLFKPIDNRSDEDKVVDALRELLESLNIDSAQVSEALTDLMSDKFTTTLNK